MTNATLLDTSFDVFGLLEEQCDIVWPSFAFEGAYSSVQSVLTIALGTLPALAGAENIGFFLSFQSVRDLRTGGYCSSYSFP